MTPTAASLRIPTLLARYLLGEFLRILGLCTGAFLGIYLLVDFFDRFDDFLRHQAATGAILRYFLYKIPLILTQVMPVAVLGSILLTLGGFSRHREITAMHACGLSRFQVVSPLLGVSFVLAALTLVWNETVVPHFNQRVRYINTVEIKGREIPGVFGTSELWSHGTGAFYNVRLFDPKRNLLLGLTRYDVDGDFQFRGVVEIPEAHWDGDEWRFESGLERRFGEDGALETRTLRDGTLDLRETPEDLSLARRDAEEYGWQELSDLITSLTRKGLDVTEYQVDLHLKIAVPFAVFIMALIATPLGILQDLRSRSLTSNIGLGLVVGFGYWVVLGFAVSLGHSGALPPLVAAWTANGIYAAIGLFFLLET